MDSNSALVAAIVLVVLLVVLGPLALLWSLNTLFPVLAIPYNFSTWCAALILGGAVAPKSSSKK